MFTFPEAPQSAGKTLDQVQSENADAMHKILWHIIKILAFMAISTFFAALAFNIFTMIP